MNFVVFAGELKEADKSECMKILAYVMIRLEEIEKEEKLKGCGYVPN